MIVLISLTDTASLSCEKYVSFPHSSHLHAHCYQQVEMQISFYECAYSIQAFGKHPNKNQEKINFCIYFCIYFSYPETLELKRIKIALMIS